MKHQVRTKPTQRINQSARNCWPPTQSVFKYWARPACSRFHPVWASNLPGWGQPEVPEPQPQCCTILLGKRFLLISRLSLLCFSLCHCLLLSIHTLLWRDQLCIHPVGARDAHKLPLLPAETAETWPHSLSFQSKGPSSWLCLSPFLEFTPVVDAFLVIGFPKLDAMKYI